MLTVDLHRLDPDDLERIAVPWDRAVDRTPGADPFCAASVWSFAAARSFPMASVPDVVTDGDTFVGSRRQTDGEGGRLVLGLDPVWGFATPVVGHPAVGALALQAVLRAEPFDAALVAGQHRDSVVTSHLVRVLGERYRLLEGPTEARLRASLTGGVEAWTARRSSRFRQMIRRLERRAADAGITFDDCSAQDPAVVMARLLDVEADSWKGQEGSGLMSDDLADFYRRVVWRLAAAEGLRVMFARHEDRDIGYVLGGVRGSTYRGLQLSQRASHAGFGLGHLLQWHQIRALEGVGVETYDLGMDMPYKHRWADRVEETFTLVVVA